MYKCLKCGYENPVLTSTLVRCNNCAYKILVKLRPQVTKTVQAR